MLGLTGVISSSLHRSRHLRLRNMGWRAALRGKRGGDARMGCMIASDFLLCFYVYLRIMEGTPHMSPLWLHFLDIYFSILAIMTVCSAAYLIRMLRR
jgi:hypothetical protein